MSEVDDLRERVAELERRIEILFSHTGAVDREKVLVDAPAVMPEVEALIAAGKTRKAIKLYTESTGAGMKETLAALEPIARRYKGLT